MIPRTVYDDYLDSHIFKGKAILVYGPRQAGKTTCLLDYLKKSDKLVKYLNGDEFDVREMFIQATSTKLRLIAGNANIVYIDEAQRIPDIGLIIKLFVDNIPQVQVIATGSSVFDLQSKVSESLTGRKYEMYLLPMAFEELIKHNGYIEEKRYLEQRMIFGSYPEIVTKPEYARENLQLLADSYLFKDLVQLDSVSRPRLLQSILKALALQIGSEVSLNEISGLVNADRATVEKYISLLIKTFVIFELPAFNKNVRNEIRKGKKIYFIDNGIRNAVIGNYQALSGRTDTGALWENYMISERYKFQTRRHLTTANYFWRTTQQQEIDYLEITDDNINAYEFKWNPNNKVNFPKTFTENYTVKEQKIITPGNYEFLLETI